MFLVGGKVNQHPPSQRKSRDSVTDFFLALACSFLNGNSYLFQVLLYVRRKTCDVLINVFGCFHDWTYFFTNRKSTALTFFEGLFKIVNAPLHSKLISF